MHNYEQLDLWQRGIALAAEIHRGARAATSWADRALWSQLTRAAMSIPANVAEGAQRGSQREFGRYLAIAMGSAAELQSLLRLAESATVLPAAEAQRLMREAIALRRMASALRQRCLGVARGQRPDMTRPPAPHSAEGP